MSDLYLIAHKVSGSPAFDVAQRIECPMCDGHGDIPNEMECFECDGLGYWWIIPTSGHRAYPWWSQDLTNGFSIEDILAELPMPPDLPDHYPHATHTPSPQPSLADRLGLTKRPPAAPILRRL